MATRGIIRRLWAGERDQVRDHLLRLDVEDRRIVQARGHELRSMPNRSRGVGKPPSRLFVTAWPVLQNKLCVYE